MSGGGATDGSYIYTGDVFNNKPYFARYVPSTLYLFFNANGTTFGWSIDGTIASTPVPDNYCGSVSQQICPVIGPWNAGTLYCELESSSSSEG